MSFKAGFVGLIGMPNAGKSTLVNALIGEKISIVTTKPQTTRRRVMGITGDKTFQAVFVDAPGVVKSSSGLNEFLEAEYRGVIGDSDLILAVLSVDEKRAENIVRIIKLVRESGKPWAAIVTKSDLGSPERIGYIKAEMLQTPDVPVIVVSALDDPKEATQLVLELVKQMLPEAPAPLFDQDIPTTENIRDMAGEIVREKCFEALSEEIPYGLGVKIQSFSENAGRATHIMADIIVDKASHKPMVIGKGGEKIKAIGTRARQDIEKLIDSKVFLEVHVVVKEKWAKNHGIMRDLGYVIQK